MGGDLYELFCENSSFCEICENSFNLFNPLIMVSVKAEEDQQKTFSIIIVCN